VPKTAIEPEHKPARAAGAVEVQQFERELPHVLARAKEQAPAREQKRTLLYDRVAELQEIGFGALRLPVTDGGAGYSLRQLFDVLIMVAAADSNLAHLYRGHIAFVERLLIESDQGRRQRWLPRILRGDLVGNAQSERQEIAEVKTTLTARNDTVFLDGVKYYTTGSIYADWIHLTAMENGELVGATVWTGHDGVRSVDDWDGFGQTLTGSGTTAFERVPVEVGEIERFDGHEGFRTRYLTSIFQLCLLAVVAGIGAAALEDTCDYVRPRKRIFGFAGETLPRESELVQAVVGDLASYAHAARSLVLTSAGELDQLLAAWRDGTLTEEAAVAAELNVFKAQQVVLSLVLTETTQLFEVGGASAVGTRRALDRHWRNVRTIASHNPAVQRKRAIGDYALNGRAPTWGRSKDAAGGLTAGDESRTADEPAATAAPHA
jgi:alkylation response protein AidB-like acyl-CoA dehydrogenase